ncbi:MAG TPA: MFS transporter [Rhizomicrobium sp.]|jgi:MFS family permease|nr:MFS transporter [Rhizomicrobium sp.]
MTETTQGLALPRRHIAAATIGNALDFYDFAIYATFAIQIGNAFFPAANPYQRLMLSLFGYGVGFVTRPVGGWFIGRYADRVGRKGAMVFTLTLTGLAVMALALVPTYARIGIWAPVLVLAIRLVQGFALGAEVGSASSFLLEASAPKDRGLSVAWQGASQGIAGALGAAVGYFLALYLSPADFDAYGWRVAFLLGGLALPFGLVLRMALPETLNTVEMRPAASTAPASFGLVLASWRIILIGAIVFSTRTVGTYVFSYITTYAQSTLHMAVSVSVAASVVSGGCVAIGVLIGGVLSDRIGRRPVMLWPNLVFLLATYPAFYWIVATRSTLALWLGVAVLSLLNAIPAGGFYTAFTESLPKHIRGTTLSLTYAITIAIFGATTQPAVTWLIQTTGNKLSPAWYLIVATALSQFAMMAIPESAPAKRLT